MADCSVWTDCGETGLGARPFSTTSSSAPRLGPTGLLYGNILQRDWDVLGRLHNNLHDGPSYTIHEQPAASGKHDKPWLHNTNTKTLKVLAMLLWPLAFRCHEECVSTYCFILSFWGPNLGPVGPLLENRRKWSQSYSSNVWIFNHNNLFWSQFVHSA